MAALSVRPSRRSRAASRAAWTIPLATAQAVAVPAIDEPEPDWTLPASTPGNPARPGIAELADRRATDPARQLGLRNTAIVAGGTAVVGAYGLAKWWQDGFDGRFKTTNEGWFSQDTDYGGADKLGHAYFNYANVRLLTPLFQTAGNSHQASVRLAGLTTVGIFTAVEVVDGYSRKYRFSPQDALMNVAGAALGVLMESRQDLDDKFDFRFAYRPSPGSGFEPFGDYSGQRYLMVAKADGFDALRGIPVLRYLEFSVGYQARGFEPGGERRRDIYVGVGLNLSRLLADAAYGGQMHSTPVQRATDRMFDLLQFPTAVYANKRLD
jgi:hypothetical protein